MGLRNPFGQLAIGQLFESLLPDFALAFTFFTALAYAVLGHRFGHQRPAIAMSAAVGFALGAGLVWWEYDNGWSVRNLGPVAIGFAVILLAMIMFQGIRRTGGSWSGALIAFGASILVAWVLGFDWPVPAEIVQTFATVGLTVGIVLFVIRTQVRLPQGHFVPPAAGPEYSESACRGGAATSPRSPSGATCRPSSVSGSAESSCAHDYRNRGLHFKRVGLHYTGSKTAIGIPPSPTPIAPRKSPNI